MNNGGGNDNCFLFPSWVTNVPQLPFFFLEVQMIVIYCVNQLLHRLLFKRIGMPPLVSQLFAGLILGDTGLGKSPAFKNAIFPPLNYAVIKCIILFSYTLSLFIIATQIDFSIIRRTGKNSMIIGLLPFACALGANLGAMHLFKIRPKDRMDIQFAVMSLPVAAFPSLVRLVTDIGLVHSELGRLTLASGLYVEIASILVTMANNNIVSKLGDSKMLLQACLNLLGIFALLLVAVFVIRPIMHLVVRVTPKDRPVNDSFVLLAFFTMLVCALISDQLQQFVFLGAFIIGGALPDGPPLGSALVDKFDALFTGILQPFFVTLAAMKIDIGVINFKEPLIEPLAHQLLVVIGAATLIKLIVTFGCGILYKMAHQDALALAFLLTSKGFLEIGTMTWLVDLNAIGKECFTVMALHVVFMATFSPLAVKLTYDPLRKYGGYQVRDMMHLKSNSGLKLVACVLRSNNIRSISRLLEFINPTRNVPICAYIIHLVKLVGRYQPVFISHDMQKRKISHHSYSEDVVWHFDRLQQCNSHGAISTHVYTALAQVDAMHEYVCTLALDKVVSIIILPFHRKFGIESKIDMDDREQRVLNTSILALSPCSVVIFVDRSHVNINRHWANSESGSSRSTSETTRYSNPRLSVVTQGDLATEEDPFLSVALIIIGGDDDREALAFAKRMIMSRDTKKVKLNVIRLATRGDGIEFMNSLDARAIDKFFHEIKIEMDAGLTQHKVTYLEITVKDGLGTVALIRSMAHEYNLIIVGRRFALNYSPQVAGLEDSCEIKELGILGDLFASPDLRCATSVLVVQQQQHWRI